MKCPRCDTELDPTDSGDVHSCSCLNCFGSWISAGALHRLFVESRGRNRLEGELASLLELNFSVSRRACPSCNGRRLKSVVIERTELDYCASCKGLFFDYGEVDRVFPSLRARPATNTVVTPPTRKRLFRDLLAWRQ